MKKKRFVLGVYTGSSRICSFFSAILKKIHVHDQQLLGVFSRAVCNIRCNIIYYPYVAYNLVHLMSCAQRWLNKFSC